MASVYKKPIFIRDPRTGQRVKAKSKKWWGRFRDENGEERRVPLATDRTAAQTMLSDLVKKAERKAAGITDPLEEHRKRRLTLHLKDYEQYLRNKGNTEDHVLHTAHRIEACLKACRFATIPDISASRVQGFLGDLRREGYGIATSNHYLRAMKMFTRWLVKDRRHREDVLAYLSIMNAETDRRRLRRPLSPEEFEKLVEAARNGPAIQRISGEERALLYIIACYTGFRRNEIGSVTPRSFDFASEPPTLTVQAANSKRRRVDVIPLRTDFAQFLRQWIEGRRHLNPDAPLLEIRGKHTAEMLRKDLARAREEWIDEATTPAEKAVAEEVLLPHLRQRGRPSGRLPRPAADVHHEPVAGRRIAEDGPVARPPLGHQLDHERLHDAERQRSGGRRRIPAATAGHPAHAGHRASATPNYGLIRAWLMPSISSNRQLNVLPTARGVAKRQQ